MIRDEELPIRELEKRFPLYAHAAARVGGGITSFRPEKLPMGGTEITDLRDYSPGDPLWRIDWGICARHDELRVREYAGSANRNAYIFLDAMYGIRSFPEKWRAARLATALLTYVLRRTGAIVRLAIFSPDFHFFPQPGDASRPGSFFRLLREWDENAALEKKCPKNLAQPVDAFLNLSLPPGELYFVSNFFADGDSFSKIYNENFRQLRHDGHSLRLVHLTTPSERCDGATGDVDIVDESRGYRQIVSLTERDLAHYQKLYDRYIESVREYCSSNGMHYTRVDTSAPLNDLCLSILGAPPKLFGANPWREFIDR
ncbi:MAG: DUF58 domain-containing protein [Planctomycetia bacterium]|nr:DUF58 domain-containing protein [Planctomycetia bacterium]